MDVQRVIIAAADMGEETVKDVLQATLEIPSMDNLVRKLAVPVTGGEVLANTVMALGSANASLMLKDGTVTLADLVFSSLMLETEMAASPVSVWVSHSSAGAPPTTGIRS